MLHILAFSGQVGHVARFSAVNLACRAIVHGERRIWRFCVRFGAVDERNRALFWSHITGADVLRQQSLGTKVRFKDYVELGATSAWKDAIVTDVGRTYGRVAPHKAKHASSRLCRHHHDDAEVVPTTDLRRVQAQLGDILLALAGRFPDIGYCQGMDYVAAFVLDVVQDLKEQRAHLEAVQEQSARAFWIVTALFEHYGLKLMFRYVCTCVRSTIRPVVPSKQGCQSRSCCCPDLYLVRV